MLRTCIIYSTAVLLALLVPPLCRLEPAQGRGQSPELGLVPAICCVLEAGCLMLPSAASPKVPSHSQTIHNYFQFGKFGHCPIPSLKLGTALSLPPLGSGPGPLQSQPTKSVVDRQKKYMPGLSLGPGVGPGGEDRPRSGA